jgi:hypothetical protein
MPTLADALKPRLDSLHEVQLRLDEDDLSAQAWLRLVLCAAAAMAILGLATQVLAQTPV